MFGIKVKRIMKIISMSKGIWYWFRIKFLELVIKEMYKKIVGIIVLDWVFVINVDGIKLNLNKRWSLYVVNIVLWLWFFFISDYFFW